MKLHQLTENYFRGQYTKPYGLVFMRYTIEDESVEKLDMDDMNLFLDELSFTKYLRTAYIEYGEMGSVDKLNLGDLIDNDSDEAKSFVAKIPAPPEKPDISKMSLTELEKLDGWEYFKQFAFYIHNFF